MKRLVVIDPGHGIDPGAIGHTAAGVQVKEADVVLSIARMMVERWPMSSHIVLTRYKDERVSLSGRCDIANALGADLFLSIHCNSHTTPEPHGYEVFTSPGPTAADRFATDLYDLYGSRFPGRKGRVDFRDGDPDKEARFKVLTGTKMAAALFEVGFISNPAEATWLAEPSTQRQIADALTAGIQRTLRRM